MLVINPIIARCRISFTEPRPHRKKSAGEQRESKKTVALTMRMTVNDSGDGCPSHRPKNTLANTMNMTEAGSMIKAFQRMATLNICRSSSAD
jgi:hypothetical protein